MTQLFSYSRWAFYPDTLSYLFVSVIMIVICFYFLAHYPDDENIEWHKYWTLSAIMLTYVFVANALFAILEPIYLYPWLTLISALFSALGSTTLFLFTIHFLALHNNNTYQIAKIIIYMIQFIIVATTLLIVWHSNFQLNLINTAVWQGWLTLLLLLLPLHQIVIIGFIIHHIYFHSSRRTLYGTLFSSSNRQSQNLRYLCLIPLFTLISTTAYALEQTGILSQATYNLIQIIAVPPYPLAFALTYLYLSKTGGSFLIKILAVVLTIFILFASLSIYFLAQPVWQTAQKSIPTSHGKQINYLPQPAGNYDVSIQAVTILKL